MLAVALAREGEATTPVQSAATSRARKTGNATMTSMHLDLTVPPCRLISTTLRLTVRFFMS